MIVFYGIESIAERKSIPLVSDGLSSGIPFIPYSNFIFEDILTLVSVVLLAVILIPILTIFIKAE